MGPVSVVRTQPCRGGVGVFLSRPMELPSCLWKIHPSPA